MDCDFGTKDIKNGVNVKMECIVQSSKPVHDKFCQGDRKESDLLLTDGCDPIDNRCNMVENRISAIQQENEGYTNGCVLSVNNERDSISSPLIDEEISNIAQSATAAEAKLQGIVFIEDAIYYRSIHHKANTFCIKLYRWYHSGPVRCAVVVATFLLLMLSFIEDPSSLSWSSDPRRKYTRYSFPNGFTEGIELVCLFVLSFSCIAQGYMSTNGNRTKLSFIKKNPWLTGGYVVLFVSFIDVIISLVLGNTAYRIRVRRLFRPYFLAQNTTMLKKTLKAMWNTVPEILSVLTLLSLHLYFFTMLGMLVFHKKDINGTSAQGPDNIFNNTEWTLYFNSVDTALISLVVLLTTANNPDVMMPSYSENRLYAIYFIVFSLVGTFLIFNLLTAIIYNQFRGYFKCSMQTSYFRRCVALSAAHHSFCQLDANLPSSSSSRVPLTVVMEALKEVRMSPDQRRLVLKAIDDIDDQQTATLDLHDFKNLFQNIDSRCQPGTPQKRFPVYRLKAMQTLQKIVLSRYFNMAGNFIVLLNAILMTVEIAIHYDQAFQGVFSRLNIMNYVFVGYYLIEQILKVLSLGRRYFRDLNCLYDGTISVALVCLEIVQLAVYGSAGPISVGVGLSLWDCARLVNILVLLRLLRVVPNFKPMALVTGAMLEIIRSLKSFAGIIIIIYYFFAIVGMMAFEQAISPGREPNTTYQCGSYEQLQYWANNFDDFASSLIVLWDVMVVNNWGVFLDAFKRAVSPWSQIYFIAWWLISAVVCINLFVALILDHFIAKWERSGEENTLRTRGTIQSLFRKHMHEPSLERIQEELQKHPFLSQAYED